MPEGELGLTNQCGHPLRFGVLMSLACSWVLARPAGSRAKAGACSAPDLPAALWCRSMLERRRAGMPRQLQPCWSCCCLVSGAKSCLPLQREEAASQPLACDCLCGAAVHMASLSAACLYRALCRLPLVD